MDRIQVKRIFICDSKHEVASKFKCTRDEFKEDVIVKSQGFPLEAGGQTDGIPNWFLLSV